MPFPFISLPSVLPHVDVPLDSLGYDTMEAETTKDITHRQPGVILDYVLSWRIRRRSHEMPSLVDR